MTDMHDLLADITTVFRKGPEVTHDRTGGVETVHVYAFPHLDEADPALDLVDCHFVTVGVNRDLAEDRRGDLEAWLADYPEPDRLAGGPSYIEVGGVLGSQDDAFRLFAVGKTLGLWDVITPTALFGEPATPEAAAQYEQLAGGGMIMISGWRQPAAAGAESA